MDKNRVNHPSCSDRPHPWVTRHFLLKNLIFVCKDSHVITILLTAKEYLYSQGKPVTRTCDTFVFLNASNNLFFLIMFPRTSTKETSNVRLTCNILAIFMTGYKILRLTLNNIIQVIACNSARAKQQLIFLVSPGRGLQCQILYVKQCNIG